MSSGYSTRDACNKCEKPACPGDCQPEGCYECTKDSGDCGETGCYTCRRKGAPEIVTAVAASVTVIGASAGTAVFGRTIDGVFHAAPIGKKTPEQIRRKEAEKARKAVEKEAEKKEKKRKAADKKWRKATERRGRPRSSFGAAAGPEIGRRFGRSKKPEPPAWTAYPMDGLVITVGKYDVDYDEGAEFGRVFKDGVVIGTAEVILSSTDAAVIYNRGFGKETERCVTEYETEDLEEALTLFLADISGKGPQCVDDAAISGLFSRKKTVSDGYVALQRGNVTIDYYPGRTSWTVSKGSQIIGTVGVVKVGRSFSVTFYVDKGPAEERTFTYPAADARDALQFFLGESFLDAPVRAIRMGSA